MKKKISASLMLKFGLVFIAIAALTDTALPQRVNLQQHNGTTDIWRIDEPNVKQPITPYPQIRFQPGDLVKVDAGGCVQHGGHGKTWTRYLDPVGDQSDHLYHGMILIPGAVGQLPASIQSATRILTEKGYTLTVRNIPEPEKAYLWLGYEDTNYDDNGYSGHDEGELNQCKKGNGFVENAYVIVTITHNNPPKPVAVTDNAPIPPHMENYQAAPFENAINFPGNGDRFLKNNPPSLYFSNKLKFSSGSITSSPSESKPRELIFFTDTLVIDGKFSIDLSANQNNVNGFLFIACRILKLKNGGQLDVSLSGTQGSKYRTFNFITEQVYLDDKKVIDDSTVLQQTIRSAGNQTSKVSFMRRLAFRQKGVATLQTATVQKDKVTDDKGMFTPLSIYVDDLSRVNDVDHQFFVFFSNWVKKSYNDLYGSIIRDENNIDKIPAAKDFMKFIALNKYTNLDNSTETETSELIKKINNEKVNIFKSGFQFERKVHTDRGDIKVMSSVNDNAIINYLPPSLALIDPTTANGNPVLGYRVFDETQPNISMLDFDVTFFPDKRLKTKIINSLTGSNEVVSSSFDEMKFTNLHITGQDVIGSQTTITALSNNEFHIRLGMNNGNTSIFARLFSEQPSDLFITGNWSNNDAGISGEISVPVSFARILNQPINIKNGSLLNNSKMPVVVEFFLKNNDLVEKLPALLIDSGAAFPNVYTGEEKNITLPADGMFFKLNPERFGDYFEQIDNSDKLTQELDIQNHIQAIPIDPLSGSLNNIELTVSYTIKDKNYQRKILLPPYYSMNSRFKLIIPKSSKDFVPVVITGKAIYENGEYTIKEVRLNDGESIYDLLATQLKNK